MKLLSFFLITSYSLLLFNCAAPGSSNAPAVNNQTAPANAATNTAANTAIANTAPANAAPAADKPKPGVDKAECLKVQMSGKRLIAAQTFPFNYEPFTGACFVTFASKEDMLDEKDVPRGSTFHIFKDGKKAYDFPDSFDGAPACWIEGVGFEDLNGDSKTDVVIAGSCLATKDSYPVNAVFANTGKDFKTNARANESLNEMKTVRQIMDYAKKNKDKFF